MSDEYRIVSARLTNVTRNALFVRPRRSPVDVSVPRSLIHAADDKAFDGLMYQDLNKEVTFRLRAWKAEQVGL